MSSYNQNLSPKKLKIAHFLVTKRKLLKKIFIGLLILLDLVIWLSFFSKLAIYLAQTKDFERMEKELAQSINYQEIHKITSPLPLEIVSSKALSLGRVKYNLLCLIRNPNQKWQVESLNYYFTWSQERSPVFKNFILPGEEKFLLSFNETIKEIPSNISCQVENVKWRRLRYEKKNLLEIPQKFLIKKLEHQIATEVGGRDITSFTFFNSSIYNFWQINLITLLYQGREVVAAERTFLKEIKSQEEKEVKIIWPTSYLFASEVKVIPEVNVLDESSFMKLKLKLEKD